MSPWMQAILTLCAVAVTVSLVLLLLALRRSVQRAEILLSTLERELGPTTARVQGLTDELSGLVHETGREVQRVGLLTDRAVEVTDGVGRLINAVSGFTRVGQLVGVATGLKRGVEVFLHRIRK
jgi:hypothetical protein